MSLRLKSLLLEIRHIILTPTQYDQSLIHSFCESLLPSLLCRILKYYSNANLDSCYNNNDDFCAIRLHKQTRHVFKQGADVMLEAKRTRLDCQLCEHRVSRGGRQRERMKDRRWVGVNVTEQSLVILPCYSDLFVILLQMFYWSRDRATHSLHCWSAGW